MCSSFAPASADTMAGRRLSSRAVPVRAVDPGAAGVTLPGTGAAPTAGVAAAPGQGPSPSSAHRNQSVLREDGSCAKTQRVSIGTVSRSSYTCAAACLSSSSLTASTRYEPRFLMFLMSLRASTNFAVARSLAPGRLRVAGEYIS